MKKYRFFFDYAKEEAWLNGLAAEGWRLTAVSAFGGYTFEPGPSPAGDGPPQAGGRAPQAGNYRIDYRSFKNRADFDDYRQLFLDAGWHHIAGTRHSGTQYFAPWRADIEDDIFSDTASKAGRYRRSSEMWLLLLGIYTGVFAGAITNGSVDLNLMLHPKLLYYTPGLWEMTGAAFWKAFLFETPFALGRGFWWVLYLICVIIFAYMWIRTLILSKKQGSL